MSDAGPIRPWTTHPSTARHLTGNGPTGSGKTTTLYAALERINDSSRNILTVEDPVEYDLDGIGQTQVNTKVDMTFRERVAGYLAPGSRRGHGRRDP